MAILKDFTIGNRFRDLDIFPNTSIQVEYVWIGGNGCFRSKCKTLPNPVTDISDIPIQNFDGSSTGQAPGKDSEIFLKPVAKFRDPFRKDPNLICLCECCDYSMKPISSNTRHNSFNFFKKFSDEECWFGCEQEYTLFNADGRTPLGQPKNGFPAPQGPYYCGVGAHEIYGREIVEAHYRACLYSLIKISGCNAEVMAGQQEFQVGPCVGIESGDQLTIARYILTRICEMYGVVVSFDPKPVSGDWNGAGCHVNFSTKKMRSENGYDSIIKAIKNLEKNHENHMKIYGEGNDRRMTGLHETARFEEFTYGVANRGASVRIPRQTYIDKKGYFEDRRPASNMDPYIVTMEVAKCAIGF